MARLTQSKIMKAIGNGAFVGAEALAKELEGAGTVEDPETVDALTDSTTGTAGDTLVEVGDTSAASEADNINNNFASLAAQVESLRGALAEMGAVEES